MSWHGVAPDNVRCKPKLGLSDSPVTCPKPVRSTVDFCVFFDYYSCIHRGPWSLPILGIGWRVAPAILSDENVYPLFRTNSLAGNS